MGRGLSDLQKSILIMAYKNHKDEGRQITRHVVEIFIEHVSGLDELESDLLALSDPPISLWAGYADLAEAVKAAYEIPYRQQNHSVTGYYRVTANNHVYSSPPGYACADLKVALLDNGDQAQALNKYLSEKGFKSRCSWEWPVLLAGGEWQTSPCDLYNYEVLWTVFDFGKHAKREYRDRIGNRIGDLHYFDPEAIGRKRYNSAKASVSRAISRLSQRGFVFDFRHGLHLTPEGLERAIDLSG